MREPVSDFPSLRPITARPVALNLAAWDIESADAEPEIEPRYCYLCHITDEDDDADLESAGFPDRYVLVCSYCKWSWQHQTDKREAWLAEEADV